MRLLPADNLKYRDYVIKDCTKYAFGLDKQP